MVAPSKILISEIGLNHFGDFELAKRYILESRDAGADLVKMQALVGSADVPHGSMPRNFYDACAFHRDQYIELVYFAREEGIELFYSIFNKELERISLVTHYDKVAANQLDSARVEDLDKEKTFVSVNEGAVVPPAEWKHAQMLMATHYLNHNPALNKLVEWEQYTGRNWGLSDHSVGIGNCVRAVEQYGVRTIEKHFTLTRGKAWADHFIFRDTVHGATPAEFNDLARIMERAKYD